MADIHMSCRTTEAFGPKHELFDLKNICHGPMVHVPIVPLLTMDKLELADYSYTWLMISWASGLKGHAV